jgi:small-conductance mechanosensitive channel
VGHGTCATPIGMLATKRLGPFSLLRGRNDKGFRENLEELPLRCPTQVRTALGLLAFILIALSTAFRVQAQTIVDEKVEEIETAPVELDGAVVLRVRGVSSFPAKDRAARIEANIAAVAADRTIAIDSLAAIDKEDVTTIALGGRRLMTVTDADASLEQVERPLLAAAHVGRLRQAIIAYRAARSVDALRRGTVNSVIATFALAILFVGFSWLWRRVDVLLTSRVKARIHSVGIQSLELMRAEQIWAALRHGLRGLRIVVLLACAFAYSNFVLAQFPWTRSLSRKMFALALEPLRVIGDRTLANVPNLVFLAVLFVVVRLALKVIALLFDAVGQGSVTFKSFDPEWAQPTYKILRVAVLAFAVVVAYPYIPGAGSAAFQGVSLFIGIVFSLGSSSAISNMIAGYMITYRRAFKAGDRVKIGDMIGDIIETRLQVTHLRSVKNEELVIPNSLILSSQVLNYSSLARTEGLILHTEVGIGYETPWRQVEALLIAAAERTPGLAREPSPFILEKALGDFAIVYELNVYCRDVHEMGKLYAALHRNILDLFNEYGVQIMTPRYERDPDQPKVVARKDWYVSPAAPPSTEVRRNPVTPPRRL